jgi:hypothetical protein
MDLSSGIVEQGTDRYPIRNGWLNALHDIREEARGFFVIERDQSLSLVKEPIFIKVSGLCLSVVLIQARPSGLAGLCRQRFVASCQADLFRSLMSRNADLSQTQEWFDRADLTTLILTDICMPDRNVSGQRVTSDANVLND